MVWRIWRIWRLGINHKVVNHGHPKDSFELNLDL
jgi:hypothetical protein